MAGDDGFGGALAVGGPPGQGGDRELEVLAGLDVGGDVPAAEQFAGRLWQASAALTGVTFPTLQRPGQPPPWPAGPRGRASGHG